MLSEFLFCIFGLLPTSLVCMVGELAVGGSVALAVGVSDRWQVTGDKQHDTCDT